ncbi:hypothetical protein Sphch_3149 [Sphingobium chlorophenolicum L-1]|uniref:Uncharacterized protein n=1 Tax=Sphingobium chlorophenolicum L-1 TaxID=690566 RepID=F6F2V2_SPHCR|nr:hypothetical protein [Sphingobium chlorophenolicum]AEG50764.1 hypothetical protein Sphch_3149 [Sphingobium chlorophenolicum L-1]
MTETTILHDRLLSKLRETVASVVDVDGAEEQAIEVAATALTDMLGIVLARLPAAASNEGVAFMAAAMGSRLARRMTAESLMRGEMLDLSAVDRACDEIGGQ